MGDTSFFGPAMDWFVLVGGFAALAVALHWWWWSIGNDNHRR